MIKFLVMDVDGTLTDGKIYMGNEGEVFKAFDIKDGYGIKEMLPLNGIIPVIITARNSRMLLNRCEELGIIEVHQGKKEKLDCVKEVVSKYCNDIEQYSLQNVAYIGDDILDLQCMQFIRESGGMAGCPIDAVSVVRKSCDYIAPHKGGEGAVRDFIEYIIVKNRSEDRYRFDDLKRKIEWAVSYIAALNFENQHEGRYDVNENFYYIVQEYEAYGEDKSVYESHRDYIDIQWMLSGCEKLYMTDIHNLDIATPYREDTDVINYGASNNMSCVILNEGSCVILFPKDAHRVERVSKEKSQIKKIVGKLRID